MFACQPGDSKKILGVKIGGEQMESPGLRCKGTCAKIPRENIKNERYSSVFPFPLQVSPFLSVQQQQQQHGHQHQHQQSSCSTETRTKVSRFDSCCSLARWERGPTLTHANDPNNGSWTGVFCSAVWGGKC